jgi:TRAP-type C4-dicarboxylate transport system permease small subunit
MNTFILGVERVAGFMLGFVAVLTFGEAALRYLFGLQIPDSYSFAGMLQAVAIFWGIASATYEGRHIAVDLLWELSGPVMRRVIDNFAEVVSCLFFSALGYMLWKKCLSQYASGETTNDLAIPLWPYVALAALGIACAVLLSLARIVRINMARADG